LFCLNLGPDHVLAFDVEVTMLLIVCPHIFEHEGSLIIVEDIKELEEDYGNSMNLSSNGRKFPTCKITSSVKLFWPCIGAPS
jgi:hypothetical protein